MAELSTLNFLAEITHLFFFSFFSPPKCRMSAARVSQLQEALDEQYSIMNSLKTKYGGGEPLPSHCLCCISSAEQSF